MIDERWKIPCPHCGATSRRLTKQSNGLCLDHVECQRMRDEKDGMTAAALCEKYGDDEP